MKENKIKNDIIVKRCNGEEWRIYHLPLSKFECEEKEYIFIRYDMNKIPADVIKKVFDLVSKEFPNNKVIGIPDEVSIKSCDKECLCQVYDMLKREIGKQNVIDVGQVVYVVTRYFPSAPYEIIRCRVNRKTIKQRETFSVSGRWGNENYYNGTFVENSINKRVFLSKEEAVAECGRLNNK